MYIYNVTFSVEKEIIEEFIAFVKSEFIPLSLECDGFSRPVLARVSHDLDPKTSNFALQFSADTVEDINLWYEDRGSGLFSRVMSRWGQRAVYFQTVLETIE